MTTLRWQSNFKISTLDDQWKITTSNVSDGVKERTRLLALLVQMVKKQRKVFFMEKKIIIVIGLIVLFFFTLLYWTRFQVIDVHAMNGVGFYKINRLTGETVLVSGLDQIRLMPVKDLEQPSLQLPVPGKAQQ
jgi:hypothetical protein